MNDKVSPTKDERCVCGAVIDRQKYTICTKCKRNIVPLVPRHWSETMSADSLLTSKTVTVLTAAKITELTTKFPKLGEDTFVHERDYNQAENGRVARADQIEGLQKELYAAQGNLAALRLEKHGAIRPVETSRCRCGSLLETVQICRHCGFDCVPAVEPRETKARPWRCWECGSDAKHPIPGGSGLCDEHFYGHQVRKLSSPEEPSPELYTQEALDAAHERTRERLATLKVETSQPASNLHLKTLCYEVRNIARDAPMSAGTRNRLNRIAHDIELLNDIKLTPFNEREPS